MKVSSGERHLGQRPGETRREYPASSPSAVMWTAPNPPTTMFDGAHGALPTRDAPLSLGVQSFHWELVT